MTEGKTMTRDEMLKKLKKTLDTQRYAHTLGVEETAIQMARAFGVDERKASLAGLLHDCAKCCSLQEMSAYVQNDSVARSVDESMRSSRALMHGPAGAARARKEYGVSDPEVLSAIRYHTTGCAAMSDLDKIIYLADMIEPGRKEYPGLAEVRALCRTDLNGAMRLALSQSAAYVGENRQALHPDTQNALRALTQPIQEETK